MHRGALPRTPRSAGRARCYNLVTFYGTLKHKRGCVFLDLWDPRGNGQNSDVTIWLRFTVPLNGAGCVFLDLWDPRRTQWGDFLSRRTSFFFLDEY